MNCPSSTGACSKALREPMESGKVSVVRANQRADFPAAVPAGRRDESLSLRSRRVRAAALPMPAARRSTRYRTRISGPLLDRIDLQLELPPVDPDALTGHADEPCAPHALTTAMPRGRSVPHGRGSNSASSG